jgi:lactaldehyde dehydrogenase / glycolaldehyde dehydrogenase
MAIQPAQIPTHCNFVAGRFVEAAGAEPILVENPATGEMISAVPDSPASVVDEAVDAALRAQSAWGKRAPVERAGYLRQIAARIRQQVDELARIIVEEQGKVLPLARVEVAFTADYLDYMAEWARRIEGEIITSDRPNENIFLFRAPIGVIGGILPWNFPFFLIARKMGPALVTGNTIVIKPSEETPNNAAAFARIVEEVGLPEGVFNIVFGRGATVGHALASHPGIGMVSMTGSVESGVKVMEAAAKNLTKVNLELGGKAPALVLADADLDLAVKAIKSSRVINAGQVCNCAERVYVDRRIADEFTEKMVAAMQTTRYGNPLEETDLDMGPLINARQLEKVNAMVEGAVQEGAKLLTGGKRAADRDKGYYYTPTVLTNVRQSMQIVKKEVFGPVVPIVQFDGLDEAITYANDSEYGLTSSIYTRSIDVAMRACNEIRFGETYINRENFEAMQGFHAGWRKSGIGGADGKHGLYEYTQTHVVYLQYR